MGLIIKATESKKINIAGTDVELPSVYGRVRFLGDFSGNTIEFETMVFFSKEKYAQNQPPIMTDLPMTAQKTTLQEGESQTLEQALICAKDYFEAIGYECEI